MKTPTVRWSFSQYIGRSWSEHFFFCSVDDCVYLIGGEFDVVHEGLLGLMTADVHHLYDSEFVGEVHTGNTTAPGGVGGDAIVARHHNFPFVIAPYRQLTNDSILLSAHFKRLISSKPTSIPEAVLNSTV